MLSREKTLDALLELSGRTAAHSRPELLAAALRCALTLTESDGCVVVSNPDLKLIEKFIAPGRTSFIIAQSIDWVDKDVAGRQSQALLTAVERWRSDWQALDTPHYLQHYAPSFVSDTQRLPEWREQKRAVNAVKTWAKIELGNLSAVQYPGEKTIAVVTFDQNYQSSNLSGQTKKRQLWQLIDGRWQIIYEGSA